VKDRRSRDVNLNLEMAALLIVLVLASASFARSVLTIAREFGVARGRTSR